MFNTDLSIESMSATLFGGTSVYGFESEEPITIEIEDGDVTQSIEIPIISDEEGEIIEGTADDATADDAAELTAESARLMGEADTMSLYLRTAEQYVWSTEKDDNALVATWKKFWNWLKGIFEKVKLAVVTYYRRVVIFLAGDMKREVEYLKSVRSDLATLKSSTASIKMKQCIGGKKFETLMASAKKTIDETISDGQALRAGIESGVKAMSEGGEKVLAKAKAAVATVTVKSFNEELYGKSAKATTISAKKYFETTTPEDLISIADSIKFDTTTLQTSVKDLTRNIGLCVSQGSKGANDDGKKNVKAAAQLLQLIASHTSQSIIWIVSEKIRYIRVGCAICRKADVKTDKAIDKAAKKEGKKSNF